MNRTVLSLTFLAVLLAGCQRPEPVEQVDDPMFLADVENFDSPTKTAMTSDRKVVWSKDDRIAIFHKSPQSREYILDEDFAGKSNGKFNVALSGGTSDNSSVGGDELPCNVALYPYFDELELEVGINNDVASYTIKKLNLPAIQNYAPNSFDGDAFLMAAVTGSVDDRNLKFKNVLGVLKLSLKGTQTVMSIMVEGKNGESLSGAAEILLQSTNSNPQITMTSKDEGAQSVTLDCGEGVQLSNSSATDFYIVLPPATYSDGFKVTVVDAASDAQVVEAISSNTVIRSSILVMPENSFDGYDEDQSGNHGSVESIDYVDEYHINHGPGVEIDGVIWAPVNCGYHATDFKWGKLYQWGRKYGQGYGEEAANLTLVEGSVSLSKGNNAGNSNVFYYGSYDWLDSPNDNLWNAGSESYPVKTEYDPCPAGWRVPTYNELSALCQNYSNSTSNEQGQKGHWFSGSSSYSASAPQVFFPAAGYRSGDNSEERERNNWGYYWSSTPYGNNRDAYHLRFNTSIYMYYWSRARGYSVRCVQDK